MPPIECPTIYVRRGNTCGLQELTQVVNNFIGAMRRGELCAFPKAQPVIATDVRELLNLFLHRVPDF
jgi:hypothetical protein